MMLKIKMGKGAHWFVVDNVESAEYEYMDETKGKEIYDANKDFGSIIVRWLDNHGKFNHKRIALMTVKYKDGRNELIFTDDTIYMLNDDGKTCDSVGVYY